MSWLGINPQILGRCSSCLATQLPVAPVIRTNVLFRHGLRYASTAAKPRAKKSAGSTPSDVASVPNKKISTKTTPATPTKTRARKKAEPPTESAPSDPPTTTVTRKTTRSASTKSSATATTTKKKKADADAAGDKPASTRAKATTTPRTRKSTTVAASEASTSAASQPPPPPPPSQTTLDPPTPGKNVTDHGAAPTPLEPEIPYVDPSSPEFKKASRKWTSVMVSLPILLVTSYYLFDRREPFLPGPRTSHNLPLPR